MGRLENIVQQQLLSLINLFSPQDINLWSIAANLGVKVSLVSAPCAVYENTIFLDDRMPFAEQRVALAHELCHYTLHTSNQLTLASHLIDDQEKQATLMSHYLLCPTDMIRSALDGRVFQSRAEIAPFIASEFTVPISFAKQRMEMFYRDYRTNSSPQLGLDYDTVWEHPATGRRIYFKNGELVKGVAQG